MRTTVIGDVPFSKEGVSCDVYEAEAYFEKYKLDRESTRILTRSTKDLNKLCGLLEVRFNEWRFKNEADMKKYNTYLFVGTMSEVKAKLGISINAGKSDQLYVVKAVSEKTTTEA